MSTVGHTIHNKQIHTTKP